jgi:hypothetical protein
MSRIYFHLETYPVVESFIVPSGRTGNADAEAYRSVSHAVCHFARSQGTNAPARGLSRSGKAKLTHFSCSNEEALLDINY